MAPPTQRAQDLSPLPHSPRICVSQVPTALPLFCWLPPRPTPLMATVYTPNREHPGPPQAPRHPQNGGNSPLLHPGWLCLSPEAECSCPLLNEHPPPPPGPNQLLQLGLRTFWPETEHKFTKLGWRTFRRQIAPRLPQVSFSPGYLCFHPPSDKTPCRMRLHEATREFTGQEGILAHRVQVRTQVVRILLGG